MTSLSGFVQDSQVCKSYVLRSPSPAGKVGQLRSCSRRSSPWGSLGQDLKVDIPGVFKKRLPLSKDLELLAALGAKRVILGIIRGTLERDP